MVLAAVGCGGGGEAVGTPSTVEWASGFCAIFDGYFSSTERQVGELELVEGPLGERLADGLSLARGQVALLSAAADAVDALAPGAGRLDEFQAEVSVALRADVEGMQRFVDEPPVTTDELQELLRVGSRLGDGAIEVMRGSEALDDEVFFALVDDPACARWQ